MIHEPEEDGGEGSSAPEGTTLDRDERDPRFAETAFARSRFIRWTLAPVVGLSALVLPFLGSDWNPTKVAAYVGVELVLVCFFLALVAPRRFEWAGGIAASLVFLGFVAYLVDELREDPSSLVRVGRKSDASAFNAVLGLFVWGLPAAGIAVSTFRSIWKRSRRARRMRQAAGSSARAYERIEP